MGKIPITELAWEYEAGLRATIQPTIAFIIFKVVEFFGLTNPYDQATLLRLFTALLALFSIFYFIKTILTNKIIKNENLFVFFAFLLSFLPFLNIRFSSETWSGLLLLIPIAQLLKQDKSTINYYLFGGILGLSFLFRYQVGFMIFGLILWMVVLNKTTFKEVFKIGIAFLGIVLLGILIDSWFYNEMTISIWNCFKVNLLEDKASSFGVDPWYYYLTETIQVFGLPLGLALITSLSCFFLFFRKHLLTWILIPFILIHFIIPHKEYRFLFPIINLIPIIVFLVLEKYTNWQKIKNTRGVKQLLYAVISLLIAINLIFVLTTSIESVGLGRIEISTFIQKTYPNQAINLVNTKWANPYKPWGSIIHHYNNTNVHNEEIEKPSLLNNELYQSGQINLFIVRQVDIDKDPKSLTVLRNHNAKIIKESFNPLTIAVGRFFGVFELHNNLILYNWDLHKE